MKQGIAVFETSWKNVNVVNIKKRQYDAENLHSVKKI